MPDYDLMRIEIFAAAEMGRVNITTAHVERFFDRNKELIVRKPLIMSDFASSTISIPNKMGSNSAASKLNKLLFSVKYSPSKQRNGFVSYSCVQPSIRLLGLCQK
jgi:hypothetical protein